MNTARLSYLGILSWLIAVSALAQADEPVFGHAWHRGPGVKHAVYPNKHWPAPFQPADRDSVRAMFGAMENQGWLRAHTLGDHLFDPVDQSLTDAGQIRVRAIASHAPSTRRMVFVSTTANTSIDQSRMASVQSYVERLPVRAGVLQVAPIDADPAESPALSGEEANRQTQLPPVRNLTPQPLFFGLGAGNTPRD